MYSWKEWESSLRAYADISFLEAKKDFEDGGSAEFLLPEKIAGDLQFLWRFPLLRRGKGIATARGVVLSEKEKRYYIIAEEVRETSLKTLKATDCYNKPYWRDFLWEGHYKRFVNRLIENFSKILEKAEVQNLINTIWQGDSSKLQEVHRSAANFFFKDLQQIRDGMFEVEDRNAKNQARVTTPQRRTAKPSSVKPPAKIDDWVGCTRELGRSFAKWFKSTGEIFKKLLWWSGSLIKKFWLSSWWAKLLLIVVGGILSSFSVMYLVCLNTKSPGVCFEETFAWLRWFSR